MKLYIVLLFFLITHVNTAQIDGWNITTTSTKDYTDIVVSHGRLGILPSAKLFQTTQIILNNVNDKESVLGVSKIL